MCEDGGRSNTHSLPRRRRHTAAGSAIKIPACTLVLSCPILSYLVLSSPILSYLIISCFSCPILSYLVLSFPILSSPVLFCPILSYSVLSWPILSHIVLSCPIMAYLVLLCPIFLSCPILSCLILSLPILSYLVQSCPPTCDCWVAWDRRPSRDLGCFSSTLHITSHNDIYWGHSHKLEELPSRKAPTSCFLPPTLRVTFLFCCLLLTMSGLLPWLWAGGLLGGRYRGPVP